MQLTNAFKIEVITRNILEWIIKVFEGTSTYHSYRLLLFLLGFLEASSERRQCVKIASPCPLCLSGQAEGTVNLQAHPREYWQGCSTACFAEKILARLPAAALRNVPGSIWSQIWVCLSFCFSVCPSSAFHQWQLSDNEYLLSCSSNLIMMRCFLCI